MLARAPAPSTQGWPPPPMDLGITISLFSGLEKLGLVDQVWLERDLSALLLRALAVSQSGLLSIWSKEV